MYNPYIVGKNVYLRHPTEDDVNGRWHEWISDEETTRFMVDKYWPNSKEAQLDFYKRLEKDKSRLVLSIIDKESDKHIGVVSLSFINWVHRFADLAIIIGEKEYRKGSHALEAVSLVLKIAFMRLNLRVIKGGYVQSNELTKTLCQVLGFKEIGICEKMLWIDGGYKGLVIVMLDRDVWMKKNRYK